MKKPWRTWTVAAALSALLLLTAAGFLRRDPAVPASWVARVGDQLISERMLAYRQRQIDSYYPGSGSREAALAQLIQGYVALELLRSQGVDLDRHTWEAERSRIERQSHDREQLAKVRAIYGADEDAYLTVGVLPDFARSRVDRFFRATPRFSQATQQTASAFLESVASDPALFSSRARAEGLEVRSLVADPASATEPADQATAQRLCVLLDGLPIGHVHPNTVETPDAFHVVRLLSREARGALQVEMVSFPKPSPSAWFWEQARAVPIQVNDPALAAALAQRVPWARSLALSR